MVNRDRLITLMRSRGLRPSDLARLSGLSTGHVSQILKGERTRLEVRTLVRLAKALDVPVQELLLEESDALASRR
ncbi:MULTISPECIES: helix-turn-helix domain-containing protein [Thermus]|uniref:Helix-turn-helix protein n=1 Tax=Thermus brockianus TaxID=56956 RepID=A0A1J0LUW8_THEBO|nr:helix-turn-helix transcriptional regulator [Thermus brockianus]APD10174.1 helix-turn-helix protein [Thermus brockianus]